MTKKINYALNEMDLLPLPSDSRLEKMVLAIFLEFPYVIEQMTKYISIQGIFYDNKNVAIWESMQSLIKIQLPCNYVNTEGYFTRLGDNETCLYIKNLHFYTGEIHLLKTYCLKLFELATLRNIIRIGYDINQKGYARNDALDLLASASNGIGELYERIANMKTKTLEDGINDLANEIVEISNSEDGMLGLKGTIKELNNIIKGYRKGNMIVIGASSGEGKTTFMLQEASFIASCGTPIGIVSLEMTQSELLLKISCEKLNLNIGDALSGRLSNVDMSRLSGVLDVIKKMPLNIIDTPALKIGEIKATARMWKNRNKIEVLFIDHLHLINSDFQQQNPEQKFTEIANQIKELSKELNIPIIALAQLSRKDNLSEKRMHVMTDLKYAGGIEQAADVIIMIFRPEEHGILEDSDGNSTKGKAAIKVEKLRLLEKGIVKCEFDGLRFSSVNSNYNDTWTGYNTKNIEKDDLPF